MEDIEETQIHNFWKNVEDIQLKINMKEINTQGSESHKMYNDLTKLFYLISSGIGFYITSGLVYINNVVDNANIEMLTKQNEPSLDPVIIEKSVKVLFRYELILTSLFDKEKISLINKIYEISKEYRFDDLAIIKFIPKFLKEVLLEDLKIEDEGIIKYKIEENTGKLLVVVDGNKYEINNGKDEIYIRNFIYQKLQKALGEYDFMKINNFELIYLEKQEKDEEIKNIADFPQYHTYKTLIELSKEKIEKKCKWCHVSETNIDLNHDLYCTYCRQCANRLNVSLTKF